MDDRPIKREEAGRNGSKMWLGPFEESYDKCSKRCTGRLPVRREGIKIRWLPHLEHPLGSAGSVIYAPICLFFCSITVEFWARIVRTECDSPRRALFYVVGVPGCLSSTWGEISSGKFTNIRDWWFWTAFLRPSDDVLAFKRNLEEDGQEQAVAVSTTIVLQS
jgi:hypothetical protein